MSIPDVNDSSKGVLAYLGTAAVPRSSQLWPEAQVHSGINTLLSHGNNMHLEGQQPLLLKR